MSVRRIAAIVLAALVLLLGCGRKGPPLPPRPVLPAAVADLRAEAEGDAVVLTWARPAPTAGVPAGALLEFRLSRSPAPGPDARPGVFGPLATVRAERPENAVVRDGRYAFRDDGGGRGVTSGIRYVYRVQPATPRGGLGPPADVAITVGAVASAPRALSASARDGAVDLAWQAPTAEPGTPAATGYNVYRSDRRAGPRRLLTPAPILATTYRDTGVENERTYHYVVRSLAGEAPGWREGGESAEVAATPTDTTAPAPPRGLVAQPRGSDIALTWGPGDEPDLLGYLVYRRAEAATRAERLTPAPIPGTTFIDRAPPRGVGLIYSVTAVDRSPRRNESAPSAEATVTLP